MSQNRIETSNLFLVLKSPDDIRALVDGMSPADQAELSADWLALVNSATSADPWIHGYSMVHRTDDAVIGNCGFKGPPTSAGVVEIAYGVAPDYQGNGYATESAQALVSYAFSVSDVSAVWAHTRPEANASTRVLTKCGFRQVGEVVDPEDGLVWRWEKRNEAESKR